MRFVLMAIFVLQLSCRTTNSQDAEVNSASLPTRSPQEIVDHPVWNTYVAEEEARYEHQDACRPASFRHRGSLRGLVVLLHGFTACPQQYFELGPLLAAEGFDVLLPVNPGHGMIRGPKEWAHLPDHSTYKQKSPDFVGIYRKTTKSVANCNLSRCKTTRQSITDASNGFMKKKSRPGKAKLLSASTRRVQITHSPHAMMPTNKRNFG